MRFKAKPSDNFKIWEHYNIMQSYAAIIRTFIDNNIINTNLQILQDVFVKYKKECEYFYYTLKDVCIKELKCNESFEVVKFNVDFTSRSYDVEVGENEFDLFVFSIETLNILPDYKYILTKILR